ncbi:GNAT family N-acetyltransferase [Pedococcus sp. KACC 23699]|uniref:GNAT family N-acetyltransferase n=1 Tax=Pedococcus sp. KACC 23699 TaxID=3149228 RepID=A0AAU7JZ96_9MICO
MFELQGERLVLRPMRPDEADVLRELWVERDDPRLPAHRRLDEQGHPTVAELAESIATAAVWSAGRDGLGFLAVERRVEGDVIGYCGLVDSGRAGEGEPEIAFELLRRVHGNGYATEAALVVVEHARSTGHQRLWATVWDWNTASRRVLAKLGFTETGRTEVVPGRGTTLWTVCDL